MLTTIFCEIDDFCKQFEKQAVKNVLTNGNHKRRRTFKISLSEIMTISIFYPYSKYIDFKSYYEMHVLVYLKNEFKNLPSYTRFLELKEKAIVPLIIFSRLKSMNNCTGIAYIDSFPLNVSHPKRISSHKTFKGVAERGKTSTGWFYGFKLHLTINQFGDIISFAITPGNVSDNNETLIKRLTKRIHGKIFGDKGYLLNKKLYESLYLNGLQFITKLKKNMNNKLIKLEDKYLLRKRGVIESVGSLLKESMSMEHARHRSHSGLLSHVFSTICAYIFREKKPSISKQVRIS